MVNKEQRIDAAIAHLEILLPELQAFGNLLREDCKEVETKTFSNRHGDGVHSMGLACFPAGSSEIDAKCVSLIITLIGRRWLGIKGYVSSADGALYPRQQLTALPNQVVDRRAREAPFFGHPV